MLQIAIAIGLVLGLVVGLAASATGNTFLVSLTVAPVPSSSVVTLAPALDAIGIPIAGLAILFGIDRIPDMMRSAVNMLSQISVAALVDRWTGGGGTEPGKPG
jgi:proton glutamate symport protein